MSQIGIEKIHAWTSGLSLDLRTLARTRGVDPERTCGDLLVEQRSVAPSWEDAVTLAVNAAQPMLTAQDRADIGLLVVGTESAVDMEKPVSSWVHHHLGLAPRCRNFEVKHACYAGTAGLRTAQAWVMAGLCDKALVITTDLSLLGLGQPYEYVLGCGAVAVVVSRQPDFLILEPETWGAYAHDVTDVIRPTGRIETGNSEESLFSYLGAVHEAWDDLERRAGPQSVRDFDRFVYHAPFSGITFRAHKALLQRDADASRATAWADFEQRTLPSLRHNRRVGGVYGGSTWLSLLGLVDGDPTVGPGTRVGVYSYGSGSCAEVYGARFGERVREVAAAAGLDQQIAARVPLDVATYEALERARHDATGAAEYTPDRTLAAEAWDQHYSGHRRLVLQGVRDYVRAYGWAS